MLKRKFSAGKQLFAEGQLEKMGENWTGWMACRCLVCGKIWKSPRRRPCDSEKVDCRQMSWDGAINSDATWSQPWQWGDIFALCYLGRLRNLRRGVMLRIAKVSSAEEDEEVQYGACS